MFASRVSANVILALAVVLVAGSPRLVVAHPSADDRLRAIEEEIADTQASARLRVEHGRANLQGGRYQEALGDADGALRLEPQSSAALLLRAETLFAAGTVDRALAATDALLAVSPTSAAGRHLRARVLRELGRLDEAVAEYDLFISGQARPVPELYIERAEVLAALGRTDAALLSLDEGVKRVGEISTLYLAGVNIAMQGGDFTAAVDRLDSLLRQKPDQVFWMTRRAEILEAGGKRDAARRAYAAAAAALPPSPLAAVRHLKQRIDAGVKRLDDVETRKDNE
jgi:tetratricopeptide (TPR) repeat protein